MAYPKFEAPKWQTGRISALRQKFAAPQVGRLKRGMSGWMGMGYDPQAVQARRATVRGFGEGLSSIMSAAGQSALSQYGQEYGGQFEAAKLGFGAKMEEERTARGEAEAARKRKWQTEEREDVMWGGARPGEYPGRGGPGGPGGLGGGFLGGGGARIRRPEKMVQKGWAGPIRAKGGPVHGDVYKVGEGGTSSKPKPELVVYKGGRMELVGKKGPEIRTFAEEGQVIPAGKTKKILKKKGLSIVSRKKGGRVKGPGLPLQQKIMQFLTSTRMDPSSGSSHMPQWQFMLAAQPQKLSGLLAYMRGEKFNLGTGAVSTGPARKLSTRKGFVSERKGVSKSPSGLGTEGAGAYAELRGFKEPSAKYKRWLGRG